MASEGRQEYWEERWKENQIGFHNLDVNRMLAKHIDTFIPNVSEVNKVFVPLCGKSLDMKWLADKGLTVVGIDCVRSALELFFQENGLTFKEENIKDGFQLLKSEDGKIRLYCGDALKFDESMEGKFDAIFDRAAFVALERPDLPKYIENVKNLLNPGGRIFLELMEYDLNILKEIPDSPSKPPPPYPMYEPELKPLFEEDHTVQFLDRHDRQLREKDVEVAVYLITKK